jgi:hypothetical protein
MKITAAVRVALIVRRFQRWRRGLLSAASHEAGRGNIATAAGLLVLYVVGL